jgi:hypothetical protein
MVQKSLHKGPQNRHATTFDDLEAIKSLKGKKEIPQMKQFKVQTNDDFVYAIEVTYRGENGKEVYAGEHKGRASSY